MPAIPLIGGKPLGIKAQDQRITFKCQAEGVDDFDHPWVTVAPAGLSPRIVDISLDREATIDDQRVVVKDIDVVFTRQKIR